MHFSSYFFFMRIPLEDRDCCNVLMSCHRLRKQTSFKYSSELNIKLRDSFSVKRCYILKGVRFEIIIRKKLFSDCKAVCFFYSLICMMSVRGISFLWSFQALRCDHINPTHLLLCVYEGQPRKLKKEWR